MKLAPVGASQESGPSPLDISPYSFLRKFHCSQTGGLFTEVDCPDEQLTIGFSSLVDACPWNVALAGSLPDPSVYKDTVGKFRKRNLTPSFYIPEGPQTEKLRNFILSKGYKIGWTDAWMQLANPEENINAEIGIGIATEATSEFDLDGAFDVLLLRGHQVEPSPEDPYGEIPIKEVEALEIAIRQLVNSGRGHCYLKRNEAEEPVSTSTVALLGATAYIANLATIPKERHRGYGRAALYPAVQAGYREASRMAELLGEVPVVCLATDPRGFSYGFFERIGFKEIIRAHGYTIPE